MGETHEALLKAVRHCQESLDKYTEHRNEDKLLHYLQRLYKLPIKVVHLEQTGVGRTVNGLRKLGGDVGDSAKGLVARWKAMVVGEQEAEEEEEEDEEEEDGYQTGEESDEKDKEEESSHSRTKDREKTNKRSHSESKSSRRDKDADRNGHRHKSHKRKDESESEEESPRKRIKYDEDRHKKDELLRKKHKSDKKEKYRDKDKHRSKKEEKKHESKTKDSSERKKDREKGKDEKKKKKVINGTISLTGIGSESGASFAEALGMCEPSSSKNAPKKKKKEDPIPKLLKEPTIEPPLDLNLSSLLPPITPNYRPMPLPDIHPKKFLSESETLSSIISSKNQRTKVYSGNKMGNSTVPSLFEICTRILQDNIDALEYTGGVPYTILKPILEKATPNQLYMMEHHNPYLIEDTDELWQLHCQKDFRNKKREEMETWREMYLRCLDERDAKLKALTANIKQAQDKSIPVRMTKLAYVDAVAKPPRNIARKQAKNGTAFDIRKPSVSPSAKLSSLATSGEAGKVSVPNPGARAVERSSLHAQKPKKAPLMLKSISSFKNRFKR